MCRQKLLIADDSLLNRELLKDMLSDNYEILEASNGKECLSLMRKNEFDITLLLLDINMPEMNGIEVLEFMNSNGLIKSIPVVMISSEESNNLIEKCYDLGIYEYITRPYNANIVRRRVNSAINVFSKQKNLVNTVTEQVYELSRNNTMMVNILSEVVEFRNNESGLHVLHINKITEILLNYLYRLDGNPYGLDKKKIELISLASSLHDIGKMAIPESILNKPGRLTKEEFEIMKTHSMEGAKMIEKIENYKDEPLIKYSYEICRWHHEKFDGRGYPDGLVGDTIPLSAQVVSIADVYDALTSKRCYKDAFSHEKAIEMICNGECGQFNPKILAALLECQEEVRRKIIENVHDVTKEKIEKIAFAAMENEALYETNRSVNMFKEANEKFEFLANSNDMIVFDYSEESKSVSLYGKFAEKLGLKDHYFEPLKCEDLMKTIGDDGLGKLHNLRNLNGSKAINDFININGTAYPTTLMLRFNDKNEYSGLIGIIKDKS